MAGNLCLAAAVIPDAQTQLSPDLMGFWNAVFPGQIPEQPIVPDALDGDVIDLEGQELRVITVGQSDTYPSTIVYVPSVDAFIAGDVATSTDRFPQVGAYTPPWLSGASS